MYIALVILHHLFVVCVVTIRWRSIYVNMMVKINIIL
nr:MAG TPA: hypothetical protein [Caudoviricetes sp.]